MLFISPYLKKQLLSFSIVASRGYVDDTKYCRQIVDVPGFIIYKFLFLLSKFGNEHKWELFYTLLINESRVFI